LESETPKDTKGLPRTPKDTKGHKKRYPRPKVSGNEESRGRTTQLLLAGDTAHGSHAQAELGSKANPHGVSTGSGYELLDPWSANI
jgi:hypothetical protein